MSIKLIITADDFGLCEEVNQGIEECIKAENVTSTNVMVNMPNWRSAFFLKNEYQNISLGIHFNLSQGKPVEEPSKIPSLVDENGNFLNQRKFRKNLLLGKIKKQDIRKELTAQCQEYISTLGLPNYWNSHQNTHLWPISFDVFLSVAQEFEIEKMRSHKRFYLVSGSDHNPPFIYNLKGIGIDYWVHKAKKKGMLMPDGVIDVFGFKNGKSAFNEYIKKINSQNKILELVIHPSTKINNPVFQNLSESRIKEYEFFRNRNALGVIKEKNIDLVNFNLKNE